MLLIGCWVAAEYFGWFTPDWFAARRWLMEGWRGPVADHFRELYQKHGPVWAQMVRGNPKLREALQPLFVWARDQGQLMDRDVQDDSQSTPEFDEIFSEWSVEAIYDLGASVSDTEFGQQVAAAA